MAFPFSDLGGIKRRPALILHDGGDDDIIVARVAGQAPRTAWDVPVADWRGAGLRIPSVIRIDKLSTLEKALIDRRLGRLVPQDWQQVRGRVLGFWAALPS